MRDSGRFRCFSHPQECFSPRCILEDVRAEDMPIFVTQSSSPTNVRGGGRLRDEDWHIFGADVFQNAPWTEAFLRVAKTSETSTITHRNR